MAKSEEDGEKEGRNVYNYFTNSDAISIANCHCCAYDLIFGGGASDQLRVKSVNLNGKFDLKMRAG